MAKLCPICDTQINGTFCKVCKKFVTPVYFKEDIHLNTRHEADDIDCDYHGTTFEQDRLYHGTDADYCDDRSLPKFNTHPSPASGANASTSTSPFASCGCLFFATIMVMVIIIAIVSSVDFHSTSTSQAIFDEQWDILESEKNKREEEAKKNEKIIKENREKYKLGSDDFRIVTLEEIKAENLISNIPPLMDVTIDEFVAGVKRATKKYKNKNIRFYHTEDYHPEASIRLEPDGTPYIQCFSGRYIELTDGDDYYLGYFNIYYDILTQKVSSIMISSDDEMSMSKEEMTEYAALFMEEFGVHIDADKIEYGDFSSYTFSDNFTYKFDGYNVTAGYDMYDKDGDDYWETFYSLTIFKEV